MLLIMPNCTITQDEPWWSKPLYRANHCPPSVRELDTECPWLTLNR